MMHSKSLSAFLAALVAASTCDAFAPSMASNRLASVNAVSSSPRVGVVLHMSDNDAAAEGETAATDESEPAPEDPEVTAIKNEIADLEKQLKEKKSQVDYLQDAADLNSKAGYARKVAEMENMRRARSSMASSNKETSIANVLRDFMVIKDKLDSLREQYDQDEFGKQYTALAGSFNTAFTTMGCSEYTATAGEKINPQQVLVVDEEYSTDFDKGTVIRPLKMGLELKGNIIRLAECVGSLGEENAENEAAEGAGEGEQEAEDL